MSALTHEELRQQMIRSCAALGIGPALVPEPEVLRADLERIKCKSLAGLIAKLIAENEPMLRAECDGDTVTVREIGDSGTMRVTVVSE